MKLLNHFLFILVFVGFARTSTAQNLMFSELLGRPTDHSITIQAFFADSVEMSIQYGTNPGNYTSQTPGKLFRISLPAEGGGEWFASGYALFLSHELSFTRLHECDSASGVYLSTHAHPDAPSLLWLKQIRTSTHKAIHPLQAVSAKSTR